MQTVMARRGRRSARAPPRRRRSRAPEPLLETSATCAVGLDLELVVDDVAVGPRLRPRRSRSGRAGRIIAFFTVARRSRRASISMTSRTWTGGPGSSPARCPAGPRDEGLAHPQRLAVDLEGPAAGLVLDPAVVTDREELLAHLVPGGTAAAAARRSSRRSFACRGRACSAPGPPPGLALAGRRPARGRPEGSRTATPGEGDDQQRVQHPDPVAEQPQHRRAGEEGDVADRGDDRHPGRGPLGVVGRGAHAHREAEGGTDAPDGGADERDPGAPRMTSGAHARPARSSPAAPAPGRSGRAGRCRRSGRGS